MRDVQDVVTQVQLVAEGSTSSLGSAVSVGKATGRAPRLRGPAFSECLAELKNTQTLEDLQAWVDKTTRLLNLHRLGRPRPDQSREAWLLEMANQNAAKESRSARVSRKAAERRQTIKTLVAEGKTNAEIAAVLNTTPGSIRAQRSDMKSDAA